MGFRAPTMPLLLILMLVLPNIHSQGLVPDTCSSNRPFADIEPNADVVIGGVLNLHRTGHGVFGCGQPDTEGVHFFEALRWAVNTLNRKTGFVNQKPVVSSFIPGVKLGLQVYDSCGHKELAMRYMTELYPVLKSGPQACGDFEENSTRIIGMVDATSSTSSKRVSEAVNNYVIPVIPLNQATTVPPEQLAKVLAEVVHDMEWERVAILHSDDEYSVSVTKVFGQIATSGYPCITIIKSFPSSQSVNFKSPGGQSLLKILSSLGNKLPNKTGIIVIGHGDALKTVLNTLKEAPDFPRFQWLFSWIPPSEQLSELVSMSNGRNVFSLSPYPRKISEFEDYWNRLHDLAAVNNINDRWFLEYAMFQKGCRVVGFNNPAYNNLVLCDNLVVKESSTDSLLRTSRFLPAFHSVFTFAHAYRNAWSEKCLELPGVCTELGSMTRREFVEKYLEPLVFDHDPQMRSPSDVRGQKTSNGARGEMEGTRMALNVYSFTPSQGVYFQQVLSYDSLEATVLDDTFHYQPSTCPKGGCSDCLSVRQSRLDDSDNAISASEDFVTVANSEDLLIPFLLPIHQAGNGPMDCGKIVNPEAIQNLEAVLWTIDQINADPEYLPGVRLGAVAIDTCSSPLILTQRLSNFLMEKQKKGYDELSSSLAFVVSGSSEEFLAASSLISPLNITVVSSTDSIRTADVKHGLLQTTVPLETKTEAVAVMLNYLGWNFVSVVYDRERRNKMMHESFKKLVRNNDVCLATELLLSEVDDIEMDHVITQIIDAINRGSKVVVMWTNEISTYAFFNALRRALAAGALTKPNIVIICNGEWIRDFKSLDGFENETMGAVTFKTEQGEVKDFATFYQRLQPDANKRNPWFRELWDTKRQCRGGVCGSITKESSLSQYRSSTSTTDSIQAVLAVSAGLARLRNEICHPERGICPRMLQQPLLRDLLHKYIRETASSRLDAKGQMFTFTKDGFGNIPMDIFNIRRGVGNSFAFQKVGNYQNHVTNLEGMMMYSATGEELMVDHVTSECVEGCTDCGRRSTDFLVLDSPDKLYLAAAMGIHQSASNPLACGPLDSSAGLQSLEAFLWALDQINASPQLLPGVTLGAVVFDTCNSRERAARDVSNFLSSSLSPVSFSHGIPEVQQVLGLVTTQSDDVVQSVVDVTMPVKMLTIATEASFTTFNDVVKYPSLLRASLPNDVIADSIVDLLKHFRWNFVSVLYSDGERKQGNLFQVFRDEAERREVEFAVIEKVPTTFSESIMSAILRRLKSKQEEGSRAVILLLNADQLSAFFTSVKRHLGEGRIGAGDFVWIGVDNLQMFHKYPDVSLGALMLRRSTSPITPFKQHFESLTLRNNSRNPWFREYYEQIYKCHGAACYRDLHNSQVPFLQDSSVPSVINSVLSLGVGLESLRTSLCPNLDKGLCPAMTSEPIAREALLNLTRATSFMGADGKLFKFTSRNYAVGSLDVFNFRQVGNNARAFVAVGNYSPDEGLSVNYSKVKAYNKEGQEVSLYDVKSQCNNSESCHKTVDQKEVSTMQIIPKQEFVMSAVMPIHRKGNNFFSCGELKDDNMVQNLAAIAYAVETINANDTLLPGIHLGALVFDYCGRRQKAEEQLYGFFSTEKKIEKNVKINPKSVIATVTYGEGIAKDLSPILEATNVVQIASPSTEEVSEEDDNILYTVPPTLSQLQVILSILDQFKWEYVNLVYSNTDFGRSGYYYFSKGTKEMGICIANVVRVDPGNSIEAVSSKFKTELDNGDANVIVMLVDDVELVYNIVESAKSNAILHKFVWLASETWGTNATIAETMRNSIANVITIKMENYNMPKFMDYFNNLTPRKHDPIPDLWFDEFWQHNFKCQLSNSPVSQKQYPGVCSGQERLNRQKTSQDKYVYHTVKVMEAVAAGLHNYLMKHCPHGMASMTIDDCGEHSRNNLKFEIQNTIAGRDPNCEECGRMGTIFGYEVFQLAPTEDSTYSYTRVGMWKNGLLSMDNAQVRFTSGRVPKSVCKQECDRCANQLGKVENLFSEQEPIYANFKEVWGIIVTALSVLGMVLVIICALYFLMSFPVTVGTTVLGYMILFGLLLLYAVNFAFVIAPTEGTCGIRRFGLGLAYAVIFSGMLVKVMNTWRLMGYNGSRMLNDGTRLSSPAGLLVIAVGLVIIQIILSAAWLILMPPKTGAYELVWRCAPPTTFEEGLVVSLVYVMLLLAITTLFAILTWQCQDNNRESRWILACATLVAVVWLTWTILSTQLSPHHRDMTIAVANLMNATIIMVCLYLRKVYLYSKLSRQARDQDLKAHLQPSAYPHSLYGTSQKSGPFSTIAPVLYGSQASLNGKKLYNGPSSRLELINCPEDNKSDSSGSVQVQAADLYPLDMYDGGSQFQPVNSLYGSNHTLVLDDTLTFGR